nr:hypothetical protein [Leuven Picorna-like virus 2]
MATTKVMTFCDVAAPQKTSYTRVAFVGGSSITLKFEVPAPRRERKEPRVLGQKLPYKPNGKVDFPKVLAVAAKHAKERKDRALTLWKTDCRMQNRRRRAMAVAHKELVWEIPTTYAEAVEYGRPVQLPPWRKLNRWAYLRPCECKCCVVAQQAGKARVNAQKARTEAQEKRHRERIHQTWIRRHFWRPRDPLSFPKGREALALLEDDDCGDYEAPAQGVVRALSRKQVKSHWWQKPQKFQWEEFYTGEPVVERAEKPWKKVSKGKVPRRAASEDISEAGVAAYLKVDALEKRRAINPSFGILNVQMTSDDAECTEDQAGNVVIQEAGSEECEVIGDQLTNLRKFCEADVQDLESDMDRWFTIANFTWSKTDEVNNQILHQTLPWSAVYKRDEDKTKPATMLENVLTNFLRVRQFMQTGMEVKVILNSSPFMVGQLQLAWFYAASMDANFKLRVCQAGFSQTDHVIVDASLANSGCLSIPYRSYRSYLPVYPRKDQGWELEMGDLYLNVLTPLQVPAGSASSVDGTLLIRFTDCHLTGMVPPSLTPLSAEMFMAMDALKAAAWLYQRHADRNRDAPPNPHAPQPMQPTAVGNLACGTNYVEPLMAMRLDPKGQTPHPEGVPDEMTVAAVASRYGFVHSFKIAATAQPGTCVFCYDAAPVLAKTQYVDRTVDGTVCYYLPPVAVVAQLFAWWRGEIQYRFDFVATKFHQMRLYFAWVPGYYGKQLTWEQAKSCAGTYYDLKDDNRSITISIPYMATTPWWPHRYANGVDTEATDPPGTFCCFIVNRLTYTNSVPNNITANVYMCGGPSFEVAVPVQPTIGLSYHAAFQNESDVWVTAVSGYYPWYVGYWNSLNGGKAAVLRYGPVLNHIAQFNLLQSCTSYKFKDVTIAATLKFTIGATELDGTKVTFVPVDVGDGYGRAYMGVIYDADKVANYFYKYINGRWVQRKDTECDFTLLMSNFDEDKSTYYAPASRNAVLVPTKVSPPGDSSDSEYEVLREELETQVDNRDSNACMISFETSSLSGASKEMFGEAFTSLKDVCRRYQPYAQVPLGKVSALPGVVNFIIPALPGGLDLDPMSNFFSNTCRDGIIPIVLSGYRFFRGGLRFKMVPTVPDIVIYMCQVKPDRRLLQCVPRAGGITAADSVLQHGYAMSGQATGVNPVMSIEIPFYMPGTAGLLCRPTQEALDNPQMSRFFSLGELAVSAQVPQVAVDKVGPVAMTIMYCLADDFSPHTFQGFPPMCFVSDSKTG